MDEDKKAELIKRIMEADIDEDVDLSDLHPYWKVVCFDYTKSELRLTDDAGYCWRAASKSSSYIGVYPMRNTQYVQLFKTLKGAKRNFIRRL